MSEQEVYTKILKKMIVKTENESIQTTEELIQALIFEMSTNKESTIGVYETNHV